MTAKYAPSLIARGITGEQRVRVRAVRSVLAAVAACLVLPGTALAATVRIDGDTLVYKSAPGEADRISADDFETNRWSFEGSFVQAGPGCEQTPPAPEVTCPLTAKAVIDLGDEDDRAGVFVYNLTVSITGGDGTRAPATTA
jgi:hypothetical protein